MEANTNQLINLVKVSSAVKKTEKHSEAFKNSWKATLMSSSLEHESKQMKLTMKENQIKDKSNKKILKWRIHSKMDS